MYDYECSQHHASFHVYVYFSWHVVVKRVIDWLIDWTFFALQKRLIDWLSELSLHSKRDWLIDWLNFLCTQKRLIDWLNFALYLRSVGLFVGRVQHLKKKLSWRRTLTTVAGCLLSHHLSRPGDDQLDRWHSTCLALEACAALLASGQFLPSVVSSLNVLTLAISTIAWRGC